MAKRIILIRPAITAGKGIGFLKGTLEDKMHPFFINIESELKDLFGRTTYDNLIKNENLEMVPLEYIQGRNFHDAVVILDEAQNAQYDQLKMVLTRTGQNTRIAISGDHTQTMLKSGENEFLKFCTYLENYTTTTIMKFTPEDTLRSLFVQEILTFLP